MMVVMMVMVVMVMVFLFDDHRFIRHDRISLYTPCVVSFQLRHSVGMGSSRFL